MQNNVTTINITLTATYGLNSLTTEAMQGQFLASTWWNLCFSTNASTSMCYFAQNQNFTAPVGAFSTLLDMPDEDWQLVLNAPFGSVLGLVQIVGPGPANQSTTGLQTVAQWGYCPLGANGQPMSPPPAPPSPPSPPSRPPPPGGAAQAPAPPPLPAGKPAPPPSPPPTAATGRRLAAWLPEEHSAASGVSVGARRGAPLRRRRVLAEPLPKLLFLDPANSGVGITTATIASAATIPGSQAWVSAIDVASGESVFFIDWRPFINNTVPGSGLVSGTPSATDDTYVDEHGVSWATTACQPGADFYTVIKARTQTLALVELADDCVCGFSCSGCCVLSPCC